MKKIMISIFSVLVMSWFWTYHAPIAQAQTGTTGENCSNGIDDDGDNKIDCQDHADCNKDPACAGAVSVDPCKGALEEFTLSDNSSQCCRPPHIKCSGEICSVPDCPGQLNPETGLNGDVLCCDTGGITPVP